MDTKTPPGARDSLLMAARARAAGIAVDTHAIGAATWLICPQLPGNASYNRAFDVDAREPGVAARLLAQARADRCRPLLEIAADSLGDAEREALAALGLVKLWGVVALGLDLGSLATLPAPPPDVRVRAATPAEAEAFAALAIRAYGAPPAGFPPVDQAAEKRLWTAYCGLGRARCFFAERGGVACAVGMFVRAAEVALVDGAATLPEHRGRGCQGALLAHRFREARAEGAQVAITRAGADSASQRNLERAGMRVWRRMEVWGEALSP